RIHGAFESLEEVNLHHRDEDALATFLGESTENPALIGFADLSGEVFTKKAGGMVEDETDLVRWRLFVAGIGEHVVHLFERRELPLEVDLGVDCAGCRAVRESAQLLHLGREMGLNLVARASETDAVEQLEKVAADCCDQITR